MQSPSHLIMLRPRHFGFDEETASSNQFQKKSDLNSEDVKELALKEFDKVADAIRHAGVQVTVWEDQPSQQCPDAVFPNNWCSVQVQGKFLYHLTFFFLGFLLTARVSLFSILC